MPESRTALVTGATGFVGRHLVQTLVARGWSVHALVRASSDPTTVSDVRELASVHEVDGSLDSIGRAVGAAAPTHCFHIAGAFVGVHTRADVPDLVRSNVEFATYLAETLSGGGCRFVNVGTIWQNHAGRPYDPASLYAATKQAFQDVLQFYAESGGLDVVTVKLCDTYGPGDTRGKLVELLLRAAATGERLALSPGEQLIDLVHVRDAAAGLVAAAAAPGDRTHPAYRLGSGGPMSLRALVQSIEKAIGVPIPVDWGARPYRPREMFDDWGIDPLVPGWRRRVRLDSGIRELWSLCHAPVEAAR